MCSNLIASIPLDNVFKWLQHASRSVWPRLRQRRSRLLLHTNMRGCVFEYKAGVWVCEWVFVCSVWGSKAESEVQPWGEEFRERTRKKQRGRKKRNRKIRRNGTNAPESFKWTSLYNALSNHISPFSRVIHNFCKEQWHYEKEKSRYHLEGYTFLCNCINGVFHIFI